MRHVSFLATVFAALGLAASACGGSEFSDDDSAGSAATGSGGRAVGGKTANGGSEDSKPSMTGGQGGGGQPGSSSGAASSSSGGAFSSGAAFGSGAAPAPPAGGMEASEAGEGGEVGFANADCADGSVTFRMLPSEELAQGAFCEASCGTGWLTVTDAEGAMAFPLFAACGTATCDHCQSLACPNAACVLEPVAKSGLEYVWQGAYFAQDTCGANLECLRKSCVPPGKYRVQACAALNATQGGTTCSPAATQVCAEAEFEFPGTSEVTLTLRK